MKKRLVSAIVFVLLCAIIGAACIGCDNKKEEEYTAVAKPSINKALENYEQLDVKKSDFTVDLTASLHRAVKQQGSEKIVYETAGLTETLRLIRTFNKEKIYLDGSLKTSSVTPGFTSLYKTFQNAVHSRPGTNPYDAEKDKVLRYMEGTSYFELKLGYAENNYNLKSAYIMDGEVYNSFWGATDNANINKLLQSLKVNAEVNPSNYLMTTGIIDLTDVSDWLSGDDASKYLSDKSNKYIYNIKADPEKLYALAFKYLERFAGLFGKEDYAKELERYSKILPYLEQWISFGPSTVDAFVTVDGLPELMTTSMQVNINIPVDQLKKVLAILELSDYTLFATLLIGSLQLCGTNGEKDTIGLSLDLKLSENFYYGDTNCSLDSVDSSMFIPVTTETENRYEFIMSDKEEEEEGEEGADTSDSEEEAQ